MAKETSNTGSSPVLGTIPDQQNPNLFLFTKSPKYYWNSQACKMLCSLGTIKRLIRQDTSLQKGSDRVPGKANGPLKAVGWGMVNIRSVLSFATAKKLVETLLSVGCPKGGLVLDPFCGSGTTNLVAKKLEMSSIGIDVNQEFIDIAKARILNFTHAPRATV